jgi:hypothetical protein
MLRAKYAATFITAPPHAHITSLSKRDAHYALCHRHLIPPLELPEDFKCACGAVLGPENFWHILSCFELLNKAACGKSPRHNLMRDALIRLITALGGYAHKEPRKDKQNPNSGPDIFCQLNEVSFLLDINITHTYSPSYVHRGTAFNPETLLEHVSNLKHGLYDGQAIEAGAVLNTFCMNTHGGMHKEAVGFLKNLAAYAVEADPLRWSYNEALRYIVTDVTNS